MTETEERIIAEGMRRSRRPETASEIAECLVLKRAVEELDLTFAEFVRNPSYLGSLVIRLEYTGGPTPEMFWTRWLVVRVWPLLGYSWTARIREYTSRVLLTVPRPDKIDVEFAQDARGRSPDPKIYRVMFGIMFPERFYRRDFITLQ